MEVRPGSVSSFGRVCAVGTGGLYVVVPWGALGGSGMSKRRTVSRLTISYSVLAWRVAMAVGSLLVCRAVFAMAPKEVSKTDVPSTWSMSVIWESGWALASMSKTKSCSIVDQKNEMDSLPSCWQWRARRCNSSR